MAAATALRSRAWLECPAAEKVEKGQVQVDAFATVNRDALVVDRVCSKDVRPQTTRPYVAVAGQWNKVARLLEAAMRLGTIRQECRRRNSRSSRSISSSSVSVAAPDGRRRCQCVVVVERKAHEDHRHKATLLRCLSC